MNNQQKMNRRRFIKISAAAGVLAVGGAALWKLGAVRLFRVAARDMAAASTGETSTRSPVRKQLLTRWITRLRCFRFDLANYEGLCLGRRLHDGRQTLLCVSDAQGGAGRWFLRLRDALRVIVLPSVVDEGDAR